MLAKIVQKKAIDDEIKSLITEAIKAFKQKFVATPKAS
jgi:hypothetical protein